MSSYYRESFEYTPIRMFLDSSVANVINTNGDVKFIFNQQVKIPNDVIGYVSLQELTIPNTNYNINTNNNTLVLVDYANNTETFTIIPGNNTVTTFLTALNTAFSNATGNFSTLTATYNDVTI